MAPKKSVRSSYLGAVGRISTTISLRASALRPATVQVPVINAFILLFVVFHLND